MKILYVVHQFFPRHITGTERLTLNIAKQIQRMGNDVSVLTYEPVSSENESFEELDTQILKKEYLYESVPVMSFKRKISLDGFYIFDLLIEKHLESIIEQFDLVHFTHPMRFASVLNLCMKKNIPTVLTLTDNWLLCPRGLLTVDMNLCDGPEDGMKCVEVCKYNDSILSRYNDAKYFFDNIDCVVSGSKFVKWTFEQNGWKRNIELNEFSMDYAFVEQISSPTEIVFGFIGSLIWQKGLHVLIDAFKKVKNENIRLKIYGKGVDGDFYPKRIKNSIKKDTRIEFCGTFDYSALPSVMEGISVLVIPSVYKEIFPLVMQLSLAYKKPVVASNIGGLPEVIKHDSNGFLFEVGNVDQLAKIISTLAEKPKKLDLLIQSIKLPPRIEEEAFKYEKIYKRLIEKITA